MKLQTKYFGEIEQGEDTVLHFPKGLFAFDDEKDFILLPFEGSDASLLCMQSVHTEGLAFVLMNPFQLKPDYAPVLQAEELKTMGAEDSRELCYYVMCVVKSPASESTVNLKCPVVVNDDTRQAMQVILDGDTYHMRHKLAEFGGAEC